jgi:hypothetical protein
VVTTGGVFPVSTSPITITGDDAFSTMLINSGAIEAVPKDPSIATSYTYWTNAEGTTYSIGFCLETDNIKGYNQGCGNILTP